MCFRFFISGALRAETGHCLNNQCSSASNCGSGEDGKEAFVDVKSACHVHSKSSPPFWREAFIAVSSSICRKAGNVVETVEGKMGAVGQALPSYRIRHTSPVAPSLTILVSVPRNLLLTSSGRRTSLAFSPSCRSSYTLLPKMLDRHSFSGSSPWRN